MLSISLVWLSTFIFAVFHSVTASLWCKQQCFKAMLPHHYRLLYSFFGIISTALWLWFNQQLVDAPLYAMQGIWFWSLVGLQVLGILIVLAAFRPIDGAVFLGLKEAVESTDPFVVQGIYKYIRHPMYTGFMLFLLAKPEHTMVSLHFALAVSVYFIVGSKFEERRMLAEHPDYADYQQKVGAFIPKLF